MSSPTLQVSTQLLSCVPRELQDYFSVTIFIVNRHRNCIHLTYDIPINYAFK